MAEASTSKAVNPSKFYKTSEVLSQLDTDNVSKAKTKGKAKKKTTAELEKEAALEKEHKLKLEIINAVSRF